MKISTAENLIRSVIKKRLRSKTINALLAMDAAFFKEFLQLGDSENPLCAPTRNRKRIATLLEELSLRTGTNN